MDTFGIILSVIGIIVSIIGIVISYRIYDKQCKHIYKINYTKIVSSNLSIEIMSLQNKIVNEIESCIHNIECYMTNNNHKEINDKAKMYGYIDKLGKLILNYITLLSLYIDALLECNEYKKSKKVSRSIDRFKNNLEVLSNKYIMLNFKDVSGKRINLSLQSSVNQFNSNLFDCIYNYNIDIESFKGVMNNLITLVIQAQRISKDASIFTIQDIRCLLDVNIIDEQVYNHILDNYRNTIEDDA